ncbi:MAG: hypothetical protein A3K19_20040 [Lentisphaerae bacterium RIFOXYB12_FULL_65_16]|nr:MAG: hypothetical protein A3K18_31040 [Lentisphaerae bacterium RIFOXYA12_64_32]OGV93628.1 MAG: hypothetical protein A3K19_20040 [Lentisphaerae bacterium RIFOXYB12_FULL_65_16]
MITHRVRSAIRVIFLSGWTVCTAWAADAGKPGANLVPNPSFEDGAVGQLPTGWHMEKESGSEGTVALTDKQAHTGKRSVLIDHTNDKGYIHPDGNVTLKPGTYLYRVWATSDADTTFDMQLYDARAWGKDKPKTLQLGSGLLTQEFPVRKDTWTRFEMAVAATEEFPGSIQIGLRKPGRLWLDDVEIITCPPQLVLADTGSQHASSLTSEELRNRDGWTILRDHATPIAGDACLTNRTVAVVFRKACGAAELYAAAPEAAWRKVADLIPLSGDGKRAKSVKAFSAFEVYPDKTVLDVTFDGEDGKPLCVRYSLRQNRAYVETEARDGTERILVSAPSKFAVVPDFFGNDLVVNAERTTAAQVRFPSERVLVQCLQGNGALLTCVWLTPDQKVRATLAGDGQNRVLTGTEIDYRKDQCAGVWIAPLVAPGAWGQKKISELTDPQGNKVDWRMPFDAGWRVDFRRQQDGLIDSWMPTRKRKDGNWEGCRDNGSRTMWTSSRDDLVYPAFIQDGALYLTSTKFANAMQHTFFKGADDLTFDPADVALVYPFERSGATPPDIATVIDIVQQTLETTPEFEVFRQMKPIDMPRHRYPATCGVTGVVEKICDEKQEQPKRRTIMEELRKMDFFVLTKRERIEEYMTWMRRLQEDLSKTKAAKPQLAGVTVQFEAFLVRYNECHTQDRGPRMKHPPDYLVLREKVAALVDTPGDADERTAAVEELGKQIRSIGGAQDAVLGYQRQISKELRQTAGMIMLTAQNDDEFNCAREVRERTMDMLWRTCGHEWR